MQMSRIVKKTVFYFQNKAIYRAEDSPTDICLKITLTDEGKTLKYFILVFCDVTWKPRIAQSLQQRL